MEIRKAGLTLLVGSAGAKLESILFKLILVNRLDPLTYGKFSIFLVLFNWLLLIATFNISIGLGKFVSEKKTNKTLYYISSLLGCTIISLIISSVLMLFKVGISTFMNVNDTSIIIFLAAVLPFAVIYTLTIFYFRGQYKMKTSVISDISLAVVRIILLMFLLYMSYTHAEYIAFLFSFVILDVVFFFLNNINLKDFINTTHPGIFRTFRKLFFYSFPIFVAESSRFLGLGFDRLLLGKFYTTSATGIYDLGTMFSIGYILIASSYANALLPIASKNRRDVKKLEKNLVKACKYVFALYILYTIGILLLAKPITVFINPNYLPVLDFLLPLLIGYALIGFFLLLSFFVNAIYLQKYAVISSILFMFMCFGLNFYLVPKFKYLGATITLSLSAISSIILITVLIWRELKSKS